MPFADLTAPVRLRTGILLSEAAFTLVIYASFFHGPKRAQALHLLLMDHSQPAHPQQTLLDRKGGRFHR